MAELKSDPKTQSRQCVLANALAAGDLGFEVTFFYVTSAIFGQNRVFRIFMDFGVFEEF